MDINTVRRANIRRLVDQAGSIKAFANKVGTDASYVSALLSDKIGRNPGRQFMRRVEKAFDLPDGSLDFPEEKSMRWALAVQALPAADQAEIFTVTKYKIITGSAELRAQQPVADYLEMLENKKTTAKRRRG